MCLCTPGRCPKEVSTGDHWFTLELGERASSKKIAFKQQANAPAQTNALRADVTVSSSVRISRMRSWESHHLEGHTCPACRSAIKSMRDESPTCLRLSGPVCGVLAGTESTRLNEKNSIQRKHTMV